MIQVNPQAEHILVLQLVDQNTCLFCRIVQIQVFFPSFRGVTPMCHGGPVTYRFASPPGASLCLSRPLEQGKYQQNWVDA